MKNKKIFSALSLILSLQFILAFSFMSYNYYVYSQCDKKSELYKIKIEHATIGKDNLYLKINDDDYYNFWRTDVTLKTGEDGFAVFGERDKNFEGTNYFFFYYSAQLEHIESESFIFPKEKSAEEYRNEINFADERQQEIYLTAYVYKGAFLPKSLVVDGETVLSFDKNKVILG